MGPGLSLSRIVRATRHAQLDFDAEDIADICWLAQHFPAVPSAGPGDASEVVAGAADVVGPPPERPGPLDPDDGRSHTARPPADSMPGLYLPPRDPPLSRAGVTIRVPDVAALADRMALSRALRRLKRRTPSTTKVFVDEEATATLAAEADLWIPVLTRVRDRLFDVAVVIDSSASMGIWRRTGRELLAMFADAGAFRDIRVWRFDSDAGAAIPLTVRGETRTAVGGRDPRELIDPTGRRAIVVFSDCIGEAWGDGRVSRMLHIWASSAPVTILQPLPHRLWDGCTSEFVRIAMRSPAAGVPNARWKFRSRERDGLIGEGIPIPVLELDERWLRDWAEFVAVGSSEWVNGMAVFTGGVAGRTTSDEDPHEGPPMTPRDMVESFRATASPQAYRLATLLAAAPLNLHVMRLVQRATMPESRPTHLAEVFLSGLLERITDDDGADPDELEYDFHGGVRSVLQEELTRGEALRVLIQVSRFISQSLGISADFLAILATEELMRTWPVQGYPFARVAIPILTALGGAFAEKADRLRQVMDEGVAPDHPDTPRPHRGYQPGRQPHEGAEVTDPVALQTPGSGDRRESKRSIIWNVPLRNPNFTGRREVLEELRRILLTRSDSTVLLPNALYGLGGVGKTQLANEYAHRFAESYDLVWWVPAEDLTDVRRSLVALAAELKLPESSTEQTVERVLHALRTGQPYGRWLLIFDNADKPADLEPYLPTRTSGDQPLPGHVLITSRNSDWVNSGATVEVNVFNRPESISLLRRRISADHVCSISEEDADRLAELMHDLPLALELAAAWQIDTQQAGVERGVAPDGTATADEYIQLIQQYLDQAGRSNLPTTYPPRVAAAYSIAYERLSERSPAAAEVLQLFAYFGAEPIRVDLLWRGRAAVGLPPVLSATLSDLTSLRRALRDIDRAALAHYDTVLKRVQVHRVVRTVVGNGLTPAERLTATRSVQRILALANPGSPDELEPRVELRRHAELSQHILASEMIGSDDDESRRVVVDQIRYRYLIGDYESSRDLARQVTEVWEPRWGRDDILTLLARRHLANALRQLGSPQEALVMDEDILARFVAMLGEDNEYTLTTANSVGADLRAVGNFHRARELDSVNLQRHVTILGRDDPATLITANNLGVDLRLLESFAAARVLDEDTVDRRRRLYGEDHPQTLMAVSNLARDMYGQGQYAEALRLQERWLPVHESVLGAAHPHVLWARRTVAIAYRKMGRFTRARDYSETVYLAHRSRLGDLHEHTLAAQMTLCNAVRVDGDHRLARDIGEEALTRYRRGFPGHPFTQVCAANLAITLRQVGEVAAARALNEEALEMLTNVLGPDHPYTLCCTANLGSDLAAAHDYRGALALSERAYRSSFDPASNGSPDKQVRGPSHPYTLASANNFAIDLIASEEHAERGRELAAATAQAFGDLLGPDHPDTQSARALRRLDCDIEPPPT